MTIWASPCLTDADVGVKSNVAPLSGTVLLGIPPGVAAARTGVRAAQKGVTFVPLTEARQIPIGSFLDTRRGTVRLRTATGTQNGTQTGDFGRGLFQLLQSSRSSARGLTELVMKGGSFSALGAAACGAVRRAPAPPSSRAGRSAGCARTRPAASGHAAATRRPRSAARSGRPPTAATAR